MKQEKIDRIISLMFTTGRIIHGQASQSQRTDVLSILKLHTLRYVVEEQQPLMKDVAQFLRITPASATSLINGLVAARLLRRHSSEEDRRNVRLAITAKGRYFLAKGLAEKTDRLRSLLDKLTAREQDQLIVILEKLSRHVIH